MRVLYRDSYIELTPFVLVRGFPCGWTFSENEVGVIYVVFGRVSLHRVTQRRVKDVLIGRAKPVFLGAGFYELAATSGTVIGFRGKQWTT